MTSPTISAEELLELQESASKDGMVLASIREGYVAVPADAIRQAEQAAYELACKAVCPYCTAGYTIDRQGNHLGKGAGMYRCKAKAIRALAQEPAEVG